MIYLTHISISGITLCKVHLPTKTSQWQIVISMSFVYTELSICVSSKTAYFQPSNKDKLWKVYVCFYHNNILLWPGSKCFKNISIIHSNTASFFFLSHISIMYMQNKLFNLYYEIMKIIYVSYLYAHLFISFYLASFWILHFE